MSKVYKIHPSIGVARVGNHPTSFYIGPEIPNVPPVELGAAGNDVEHTGYKQSGQIRRQAARFRVFEYDEQPDGTQTLVRELTCDEPDQPIVEWKVDLVNSKAAGKRILSTGNALRNPTIANRDEMIIRNPTPLTIAGANQSGQHFDQGKFQGRTVDLGELRTDAQGRLLVLGGHGVSDCIPAGKNIGNFANNDFWHDDVGDGPVTATVKFAGQPDRTVDAPAWVIVGPPDFAPGVGPIIHLHHVAFEAALARPEFGMTAPGVPSFRQHIFPILLRAANSRWVQTWDTWNVLSRDWALLSSTSDPAAAPLREAWRDILTDQSPLSHFEVPPFLAKLINDWSSGDFVDDWDDPVDEPTLTPDNLDRAALEACTGANFFPGIEASSLMQDKTVYMAPFRFSHTRLKAGDLSQLMAVPWQADFLECRGNWWPSQRPDDVFVDAADAGVNAVPWAHGADSDHEVLVKNFGRLGFVVPREIDGETFHLEVDRDPTLPPRI